MLATHLGFYNTASSRTHVRLQFSTHAAAGGNVAPNSALEAADLRIYKAADGAAFSATQRSSANGITMTSPFDSLTGFHDVDIDLTDNTDAGFYAAGSLYSVVLAPDETVDGQTLTGVVLAYFEIGVLASNVTQFGGTAGTFSSGRPEVNATHFAGQTITAGAGVTIPASIASPTNITAGTITTVTNLTNAPTAGDFNATMKTSLNAATPASVTGAVGSVTGAVGSVTGAVGSVTGNVGGNVTGSVGSLAAQAKADVNAEVVDALNVDTYAEPGQGTPGATITLAAKLNYLYKAWRNRTTQTASEYALYGDDAVTKDQEAVTSDDGTTYDRGEVRTGA